MHSRSSGVEAFASKVDILDLPLTEVLRPEIALPLQHMMRIYTVGNLLRAWDNPAAQPHMEQLFDSAEQAQHAVTTCAAMAGWTNAAATPPLQTWWRAD
jgi:hypothetical protein